MAETSGREAPDEYLKRLRAEQGYMPVGDHLEELRARLIRMFGWIAAFAVASWFFYDAVFNFIMGPVAPLLAGNPSDLVVKIITTKLADFFAIEMKVAILSGFILAIPFVLFEFWGFLLPALDKKVKHYGNGILFFATLLFWAGVLFCRQFVWGTMVEFMTLQWAPPAVMLPGGGSVQAELHLTISDYLSFFFSFHIMFGLAFELPIISLVLAVSGVLSSDFFARSWRYAIVAIAVVSALVTPTDGFSMVAMMIPLVFLFFLSWGLVRLLERKEQGK